jgi:ribosome maturation factor RimP
VTDLNVSDRVRDLVEPLLAEQGVEVIDVVHSGAILRITVDRPGGIDTDALSTLSGVVSEALDRDDPIPGRYSLEVSSPGIERSLRTPEHYRRFVGHAVTVRTRPGADGERRLDGTLQAADDSGIVVALEGDGERRVPYEEIERARTRFVWGSAPRPAGSPKRKVRAR